MNTAQDTLSPKLIATEAFTDASAAVGRLHDIYGRNTVAVMDDGIVNGTLQAPPGTPTPLALFRAARVDYSLHRLYHYTGTDPEHFQNFVILTNYQFYADAFALIGRERMRAGHPNGDAFVEPGNIVTRNARLGGSGPDDVPPERMPQMPAWHLGARLEPFCLPPRLMKGRRGGKSCTYKGGIGSTTIPWHSRCS
jgi:AMP nucleosidase